MISDIVKDFNTEKLIEYLGRKDLKFKESHFKILCKKEIAGSDFLELTEEKFCSIGFAYKIHWKSQPEITKLLLT